MKTIVTTELLKDIADKNGVEIYDVYTGFKWIADMLRQKGADGYIGAGEESTNEVQRKVKNIIK